MADKTIDQLDAATLAQLDEQSEFETQVMDLAAPTSRKVTTPQSRFLHLDLAQLTAELAVACTDPTAALMLIVDPVLADGAATRNVRSMLVSQVQILMATRVIARIFALAAKVGTTAGWVVNAANNLGKLATIPASQANSTLVIPLDGFKVGDTITAWALNGSLQSAGANVTIIGDLRCLTANAAGATDASIGVMAAALTVVANTVLSAANAGKVAIGHVVAVGETFYLLVTATTAAATTEEIQSVVVTVTGS